MQFVVISKLMKKINITNNLLQAELAGMIERHLAFFLCFFVELDTAKKKRGKVSNTLYYTQSLYR